MKTDSDECPKWSIGTSTLVHVRGWQSASLNTIDQSSAGDQTTMNHLRLPAFLYAPGRVSALLRVAVVISAMGVLAAAVGVVLFVQDLSDATGAQPYWGFVAAAFALVWALGLTLVVVQGSRQSGMIFGKVNRLITSSQRTSKQTDREVKSLSRAVSDHTRKIEKQHETIQSQHASSKLLLDAIATLAEGIRRDAEALRSDIGRGSRETAQEVEAHLLALRTALTRQEEAREKHLATLVSEAQGDTYLDIEAAVALYSVLAPTTPLPSMSDWAISPQAAKTLIDEFFDSGARTVLEMGSGVSTVLLGLALKASGRPGRVVALEHDAAYATKTRRLVEQHNLSDVVTVLDCPLVPVGIDGKDYRWYDIEQLEEDLVVDLLFVDGPPAASSPEARMPAVPLLWSRLAPDATVLLDDARRPDEQRILTAWTTSFPGLVLIEVRDKRGTGVLRRRTLPAVIEQS